SMLPKQYLSPVAISTLSDGSKTMGRAISSGGAVVRARIRPSRISNHGQEASVSACRLGADRYVDFAVQATGQGKADTGGNGGGPLLRTTSNPVEQPTE